MDLKKMYNRRFGTDIEFRQKMYRVLCKDFFQKYVPAGSTVLDLASGYCEFINNINADRKIALDMNPDVKEFADSDVDVIISSSTSIKGVNDGSVDVVFTSNFFEHLSKEDIVKTVREVNRVLKRGGRFLILQPNIRYCQKDYWMFFDHITALDDRSLGEVLELNGFKVALSNPKFLPYTTKSKLPKSLFLLKMYLKMPIAWKVMGKQAFVIGVKE